MLRPAIVILIAASLGCAACSSDKVQGDSGANPDAVVVGGASGADAPA